jgi:hypothetical protein
MKIWGAMAVAVIAGAACTPDPAPKKPAKPHPYFPIGEGAVHALGRATALDGEIKCTSCHALTVTNYAQFECTGCHEHAEDAVQPLHQFFDPYVYVSEACYGCHRDGTTSNSPRGRADATDPAHDVAVSALVPTWSATSIVSVTQANQSLPMHFTHRSAQIPAAAKGKCASCHADAEIGNFYPGQFHGSLDALVLPQPAACSDCHAADSPLGFVGPPTSTPPRTPQTGEMKHDAVAWAGNAPTGTAIVTADCSTCHVPPAGKSPARWQTDARFHPAVTPGSCLDCHANTRPGVLDSTNAAVPPKVKFDHGGPVWLGDCSTCHTAGFASWAGGKFHLAGQAAPASCLPCHAGERPTAVDGGFSGPPFDFGTNAQGITHGDGQDCTLCHKSPSQSFAGGSFTHGPTTVAGYACAACHSTQRPTAPVSGFDHSTAGTGDCFGCHQSTSAFAALTDWAGGKTYPGSNVISSTDQFIKVTQFALKRGGPNNLVTGTTQTDVTLYNAMLHTSAQVPAAIAPGPAPGDMTTCGECHALPSFLGGQFHAALVDAGFPQPAGGCTDCHAYMRPAGVVQKTSFQPMDHDAKLKVPAVIGGSTVSALSGVDCSTCHGPAGGKWNTGNLHTSIGATPQLEDCTSCHYLLMADGAKADVISAASPKAQMKHRSSQLTSQKCDGCHPTALSLATAGTTVDQWKPGSFHSKVATQPSACVDCHAGVTTPTQPKPSAFAYKGQPQVMNHAAALVTAKDCAFCHLADAKPAAASWSPSTHLHIAGIAPTGCQVCHATNAPASIVDSTVVTSASASTGVAGAHDQISHADVNVTGHDCNFCHTQVGIAAAAPVAGQEWAQAGFHARFTGGTALVMNGSTGRCSNCHLNVKPGASFTAQNHSAFTATSATDCSACHQWPGSTGASSPSWHRSAGAPSSISVGGFSIAMPPASAAATQAGVNGLAHPAIPSGASCTTCHVQASGGRGAFGYDHASAPNTACSSCHEAGSDLVGTPWTLNATGATNLSATCAMGGGSVADRGGDTRPVGLSSLACSSGATGQTCGAQNCVLNHFYPSDCGECHAKPAAVPALVSTGSTYVGRWAFKHFYGPPAQQSTCCHCHGGSGCP